MVGGCIKIPPIRYTGQCLSKLVSTFVHPFTVIE
jgi:hypothetical protein